MTKNYPPGFESRINLADEVPLPVPLLIQCEPSSSCNFKCHYCIHGQGDKVDNSGRMEMDTFTLLCNQINEFETPIKQFNFCGWGEPLLHRHLPEMVRIGKAYNVATNIAIVTNGLLLSSKISKSLVSAGLDSLRVSIQGLTNKRYKEVTDRNVNFTDIVDSVAQFYKIREGCELTVKFADTDITKEEEEIFHDIFDLITDRAYVEYIKPVFVSAEDTVVSRYGIKNDPTLICPQPFYMMDVGVAGNVIPCCSYFSPLGSANIHQESLKKIWNGRQMLRLRLMQLSENRKHQHAFPECRECNIPGANIGPGDDLSGNIKEIKKRIKGD